VPLALSWLKPGFRHWPRWQSLGPGLAALVVLAAGAVLITAVHHNSNATSTTNSTQPPPQAYEDPAAPIIMNPVSNADNVGECIPISLSGHVPAGEELVVATQLQGSDQWYFKPASQGIDSNTWTAQGFAKVGVTVSD
jgi:hypothetical protein